MVDCVIAVLSDFILLLFVIVIVVFVVYTNASDCPAQISSLF